MNFARSGQTKLNASLNDAVLVEYSRLEVLGVTFDAKLTF